MMGYYRTVKNACRRKLSGKKPLLPVSPQFLNTFSKGRVVRMWDCSGKKMIRSGVRIHQALSGIFFVFFSGITQIWK